MQVNLLKSIVEDIAGKPAREIVDLLFGKKDLNEFLITKKMKLTINQTRNILYKLSDSGLVSFTRKKDKRKGWYIYFWTLDTGKSLELLDKKILAEIENLENQLKNRKTRRFYFCETCNVEVGEETALLNNFICHECGQVYRLMENDKIVIDLGDKIAKLRKDLDVIRIEKSKVAEKESKRSIRREKKADKKEKERKSKERKAKEKKTKKPDKATKKKVKNKKIKKRVAKKVKKRK